MRRSIVGSDFVILWIMLVHSWEAYLLTFDATTYSTITMKAFLMTFGSASVASVVLLSTVLMAAVGQWVGSVHRYVRFTLLIPQLTLLMITSASAVHFAFDPVYLNEVNRTTTFVLTNQLPRIGMPLIYLTSILTKLQ